MSLYSMRTLLIRNTPSILAGLFFVVLSVASRHLLDQPTSPWTIHLFPFLLGALLPLTIRRYNSRRRSRMLADDSHFLRLYHTAPIMLHSMDDHGKILHVSDHWLRVLGYERHEVLGRSINEFFTEESRRRGRDEIHAKLVISGSVKDVPLQMISKQGVVHEILLSATTHYNVNGAFLCSQVVMVDMTEKQRDEQRIRQLAYEDTLTQLPNRSGLEILLRQALKISQQDNTPLAVFSLDLDHFKQINDTLGSKVGNQVLEQIAQRLKEHINDRQIVARLGGDEFVIVIPDKTSASALRLNADILLKRLSEPLTINHQELFTSVSIGIAIAPQGETDVDTLLGNANQAMYQVKRNGRNDYAFFTRQMSEQALRNLQIETDLRRAVENNELELFYQPQTCSKEGKVTALEALIRWRHPNFGLLSPMQFIPIAETSGQIIQIGHWVFRQACEQAQAWKRQGWDELRVAINISPRQFQDIHFIDKVDTIIEETGIDPTRIELEITETILMDSSQLSLNTLTDLKVRGFTIAIDDFGTGYSSLMYLKNFPIDRLKIPREFIMDIEDSIDKSCVVESIIALSQSLKLGLVAEGVETRNQLDFLLERCHCSIQGYYFASPMTLLAVNHYIGENRNQHSSFDASLSTNTASTAAVSS
ncbi:EAL domain-containing protein [Desulfuromonas acetoxidans]|uniref:putative bifunctional diguanylate cyclase/phosphodiesterase n=1 Tax=Desulfuromonas acetoxidans TaxID=891 RepID=UPI00159368FD|nr:EAL domain-containing protein [Desulfuromonas acetoxidans]MBF0646565.1 EAL domain-containing protein [Desulfuromonas acetoxidans]NVD25698.1 EAL domain-containing protein [Desulfuromonas acetoxidans]NVE16994.1 EAL domain-containing protein [Desulfuromonas acetoxidans]